jgi:hypothetical protein
MKHPRHEAYSNNCSYHFPVATELLQSVGLGRFFQKIFLFCSAPGLPFCLHCARYWSVAHKSWTQLAASLKGGSNYILFCVLLRYTEVPTKGFSLLFLSSPLHILSVLWVTVGFTCIRKYFHFTLFYDRLCRWTNLFGLMQEDWIICQEYWPWPEEDCSDTSNRLGDWLPSVKLGLLP